MLRKFAGWFLVSGGFLIGQIPLGIDPSTLKSIISSQGISLNGNATPSPGDMPRLSADDAEMQMQVAQDQRLDDEIKAMKGKETGPRRFASDLFDVRQRGSFATDGGVSEEYILGTGDQLYLNAVGSASFDVPLQVDGRGEVVIPKVGTAKVGGLSLGRAKDLVQGMVSRNFSNTKADLQVVRLREVRVAVLGEVYKPGTYLVPSLASLVNVLSLTGGPTANGSYRDIRVVRGGKIVFRLDLYPLRAEGIGNPNYTLQNGDVVFVPLLQNQVILEGAFTRVVAGADVDTLAPEASVDPVSARKEAITREIKSLKGQLEPAQATALPTGTAAPNGTSPAFAGMPLLAAPAQPAPIDAATRGQIERRIAFLNRQLTQMASARRGDHRLQVDPLTQQILFPQGDSTIPSWLRRWQDEGIAPLMAFEVKPGETVLQAYQFAGGLVAEAGTGTLIIRRRDLAGRTDAFSVLAAPEAMGREEMTRGDVLSALPQRDTLDRMVEVRGWARIPGTFSRPEGLRVGDLLKRDSQVLPTTYRARGEIIRTLQDGSTRYLSFDVDKALAGDSSHSLLLMDRDRIELYHVNDFRERKIVSVSGPVAFPGPFNFHEGMRASDLLFRAGLAQKSADRMAAELARAKEGAPNEIIRLDLTKLLSTDASSPVRLEDDRVNPVLRSDDQISLFEKPDFKVHRVVQISGQVARPGSYALESEHESLRQLIQRAGGLTDNAMGSAGVFLRKLGTADDSLEQESQELGLGPKDPTANGINDVLNRMKETKRQPTTGALLSDPVLHGLQNGNFNRLVVDFRAALKGDAKADVELLDGDQIIIPRTTDAAYVVGETASPFAAYKIQPGMSVGDLLKLAGGPTRNADTWNIRLMKADGRIIDRRVTHQDVEPGDAVLVPQRIRRDFTWQENLAALTPLALILNVVKK